MAAVADADVLSRMAPASAVLRAAGVEVEPAADTTEGLLRQAVRWQRYARGPAPERLRNCGMDLARGSLRLWTAAGGVPGPVAPVVSPRQIQLARMQLSAQCRTTCSQLRAQLVSEAATLPIRGLPEFGQRLRAEVARTGAEWDGAVSRRIAALGVPDHSVSAWNVGEAVPPPRNGRLENRLTTVLGVGFGTGVAVTVGRFAAALWPDRAVAVGIASALLGLSLMCWVVAARRLLIERTAAERWVAETTANMRTEMEERLLTRMLDAESATRTASAEDAPNYQRTYSPR